MILAMGSESWIGPSAHYESRVLLERSFSCQQAAVCSKFIDLTTAAAPQRRSVDANEPS